MHCIISSFWHCTRCIYVGAFKLAALQHNSRACVPRVGTGPDALYDTMVVHRFHSLYGRTVYRGNPPKLTLCKRCLHAPAVDGLFRVCRKTLSTQSERCNGRCNDHLHALVNIIIQIHSLFSFISTVVRDYDEPRTFRNAIFFIIS